jgi:hypothetical protein
LGVFGPFCFLFSDNSRTMMGLCGLAQRRALTGYKKDLSPTLTDSKTEQRPHCSRIKGDKHLISNQVCASKLSLGNDYCGTVRDLSVLLRPRQQASRPSRSAELVITPPHKKPNRTALARPGCPDLRLSPTSLPCSLRFAGGQGERERDRGRSSLMILTSHKKD